jgi:hypothetical protein
VSQLHRLAEQAGCDLEWQADGQVVLRWRVGNNSAHGQRLAGPFDVEAAVVYLIRRHERFDRGGDPP